MLNKVNVSWQKLCVPLIDPDYHGVILWLSWKAYSASTSTDCHIWPAEKYNTPNKKINKPIEKKERRVTYVGSCEKKVFTCAAIWVWVRWAQQSSRCWCVLVGLFYIPLCAMMWPRGGRRHLRQWVRKSDLGAWYLPSWKSPPMHAWCTPMTQERVTDVSDWAEPPIQLANPNSQDTDRQSHPSLCLGSTL